MINEKDTSITDKETNFKTEAELDKYLNDNKDIIYRRYADWLNQKYEEYKAQKKEMEANSDKYVKEELYTKAYLSHAQFYAIRNGTRNPSREAVIKLGLALELSLEELNSSLKLAGLKEIYSKKGDDLIIKWGIDNKKNIYEINQALKTRGAKTVLIDPRDE